MPGFQRLALVVARGRETSPVTSKARPMVRNANPVAAGYLRQIAPGDNSLASVLE